MPLHEATRNAVMRFMSGGSQSIVPRVAQPVVNVAPPRFTSTAGPILPPQLESGIADVLIRGAVNVVDQIINRNQEITGPIPGPGVIVQNGNGEMREMSAGGQPVMVRRLEGGAGCPATLGPGCPGYHANKSGHWTASGYVPKGSKWVKNRRMNPLNPRAARRSIRRLQGTAAFARAMGFKGDIVIKPPSTRRRKML